MALLASFIVRSFPLKVRAEANELNRLTIQEKIIPVRSVAPNTINKGMSGRDWLKRTMDMDWVFWVAK